MPKRYKQRGQPYTIWIDSHSRSAESVTAVSCRINRLLICGRFSIICILWTGSSVQYALDWFAAACHQAEITCSTEKTEDYGSAESKSGYAKSKQQCTVLSWEVQVPTCGIHTRGEIYFITLLWQNSGWQNGLISRMLFPNCKKSWRIKLRS